MRSTNVYEERSLGIFEENDLDIENEADYPKTDSRVAIWGRYLGRHMRRQLSFGMPAHPYNPKFKQHSRYVVALSCAIRYLYCRGTYLNTNLFIACVYRQGNSVVS